jgi:hypothetical protein
LIRIGTQGIRMLKWLGNLFERRTAVGMGRNKPALHAAVHEAALIFDALPGKEFIDESARRQLARRLYLDLHEIFNAGSPLDVVRGKLAAQMLRLALFQVLLIPPPAEPDRSGLRGLPGITGELQEHLESIARNSSELHAALYENALVEDDHAIHALLVRAYWQCCWCLETYNAARKAIGDVPDGKDWYRPFLFAACANQENSYRLDLRLPPALEPHLATVAPVAYSLFADIVLSGAADPLSEWTEYHRSAGIPMPDFDSSTTLKF